MYSVKIAFAGLYNELNLGDSVIFDCTEWLYKKYVMSCEVKSQRFYLDYIQKIYKAPLGSRIKNRFMKLFVPDRASPALIHVFTRDDLETLISKYYDNYPQRPILRVADPAVWASEVYGITKNQSSVIGIGIARGEIFQDNGISVNPEEIRELYKAIVEKLIDEGNTVEVFTSGLPADNAFAELVCADLRVDGKNIYCRYPSCAYQLVEIISNYQAIVALRLHACIIAYSLEIPAIGLVWNDKLSLFGRNIHAEDNFIKHKDFNSEYIVKQLYWAINRGYNSNIRLNFRQTIISDIMEIDKKIRQIVERKYLLWEGVNPFNLSSFDNLRFCA